MAKRTLFECDACGNTSKVVTVQGKRGNVPFTGDLCEDCWTRLADEFSIQVGTRSPRKEFVVYDDITDIPK